ncbi:MAG: DUF1318 domain-containing protein [Chthoniobacterales bacterium]|nr:DUF1318 domain-containing protein [Chthoniobacterales bacterium]
MNRIARGIFAGALLTCASCSLPPLSLSTPQPIKVDLAMKLDVYQHSPPGAEKKPATVGPAETAEQVQDRRRLRLGELQPLKNARFIGENHLGLLEVRNAPPGEYGDYVRETVASENKDRASLMDGLAKNQKISLPDVEKEQAAIAANNAFSGEWVELPKPDGTYAWKQKGTE